MEHWLYCPKCHGQFRDWVEVCPQCHVHLVQELPEPPVEWFTGSHSLGVVFGGLTLLAGGVGIVPEGIIGPLRLHEDTSHWIGNSFAMLLVGFVSALLCSPDKVYRRFPIVICAGAGIAAIAGMALIVAAFRFAGSKEPTLAPGIYALLAFPAGLLGLIDFAVLCGRLWWARRKSK